MKLYLISILIFIFCLHSSAQTFIGIDGALNSSHWTLSINGSSLTYPDKIGWSAGVPVVFTVSKLFDFGTGVRFANKGTTTIAFNIDNIEIDPKLAVYYIEVPFLLKGKFGSEKIKFNPIGGFSMGYGIAGNIDEIVDDGNGIGHIHTHKLNFEYDNVKRLNVQLHIGMGLTFLYPNGKLFFDIQYLNGINNISVTGPFEEGDGDSYSLLAKGFEFSAGYLFRIGQMGASASEKK